MKRYKLKGSGIDKEKKILIASAVVFVLLISLSIYSGSLALFANMLFLGMLVLIVPFSMFKFFRLKKIRAYEKDFPNFLRDISESLRAGLSLIQAIQATSKSDYGSLTGEIKKMNNQLSWNVPLDKVLKNFGSRTADSKIITRSLMIIDQANKSGGNIEDTMDSLASHIESLKEAQQEKSVLLNQQVLMMYAIFFIFLGITIALIKFLIPLLQTQAQTGGFGISGFNPNPCSVCVNNPDGACAGCYTFGTIAEAFELGNPTDAASYYKALFLAMILIQGFFSGLIAGQIGSDSVVVGIKHSLIMLLTGFIIFIVLIRTGIV
ncbi:MAG: type II secretion system F family protein [Candidatus Aenigmarchaeota archaeon]|nr:type II secretion system F family protein [Candidatus Aenigmarchaeota archaeon]